MRSVKRREGLDLSDSSIAIVDWRNSPETVLDEVDTLLVAHGLEVVMIETHSDEYAFRIEERRP